MVFGEIVVGYLFGVGMDLSVVLSLLELGWMVLLSEWWVIFMVVSGVRFLVKLVMVERM